MATLISALNTLTGSVNNNTTVFPVLDQTISSAANRNKKARITAHNLYYSNNYAVSGLSSYDNYFGTGADGSLTISSSAQVSASLNNTIYGDAIVKNYQNLTINVGALFSPLRPCRGMIIYCSGNLTVNGTISMTGKGGGVGSKIASPIGFATSTDSRYDLVDATLYFNNFSSSIGGKGIPTHWNWAPSGSTWFSNYKIRIPLSGSVAGGAAGTVPSGPGGGGTAGTFCCGGGGGGGSSPFFSGGAGGRGTIFTGGGGGGGSGAGGSPAGGGGSGLLESAGSGGLGAFAAQGGGGGGAGNPNGSGATSAGVNGGIGVGGLLLIIVRGNVTVNGTISNNGSNGGAGGSPGPNVGCGGGGSGGGRTIIIYGGTYTNAGSVVANGGSGGGGSTTGGAGGAGAITVRKVHI
jgi:hypothetical protein